MPARAEPWGFDIIPHRVVIGDRGLKEGVVEYQHRRDAQAAKVPLADAVKHVAERLAHGKAAAS